MQFKEIIQYSEKLNILYVEDNLDTIRDTSELLNVFFNTVDLEMDGESAWEACKRKFYQTGKHYDIIITESDLPVMSGDILISKIRNLNSEQVIIVLSLRTDVDKLISFIKNGVKDFIKKPIVTMELQDSLYTVCKEIITKQTIQEELTQTNTMQDFDYLENDKLYDIHKILC